MRGVFGAPGVGLQRPSSDAPKGEEEPGVENRLVLCSSKDEFVLQQDVCVMCGAYGNDFEGRLISCAQCGQCYHPFCVNVKVSFLNLVLLYKNCNYVILLILNLLLIRAGDESCSSKGLAVFGLYGL